MATAPHPLLRRLAASPIPLEAQRVLAERKPHWVAARPDLDDGLWRELFDTYPLPGESGLFPTVTPAGVWIGLVRRRLTADQLERVVDARANVPAWSTYMPVDPGRLADVVAYNELTPSQWARLCHLEEGPQTSTSRNTQELVEEVLIRGAATPSAVRRWAGVLKVENRLRFVLDHPGADDEDAALLDVAEIRSVGTRISWLFALLAVKRPKLAERLALEAADRCKVSAVALAQIFALGVWSDVVCDAFDERLATVGQPQWKWFDPVRMLADPLVPVDVATRFAAALKFTDPWSGRPATRDAAVANVIRSMPALAAGPKRAWPVLARFVHHPEVLAAWESAAGGHGAEYDAQWATTCAAAAGTPLGLDRKIQAAEEFERRARGDEKLQPLPDDVLDPLLEACGSDAGRWRLCFELAADEPDVAELSALVELAFGPIGSASTSAPR